VGGPDGFFVDPDGLSDADAGVGRLLRNLDELADIPPELQADAFGNAELAKSVAEFGDRWQDGIKNISADAESLREGLGATADHYRRVDEGIAAEFDRLSERDDNGRG
jgi:hypothetical protein